MKFSISNDTIDALKKSLDNKGKDAVRIVIKGFGWGGPSFGVVLDEQKSEDDIHIENGIKIVADKEFSFLFDDAKIVHTKGIFGDNFNVMVQGAGNSSCN